MLLFWSQLRLNIFDFVLSSLSLVFIFCFPVPKQESSQVVKRTWKTCLSAKNSLRCFNQRICESWIFVIQMIRVLQRQFIFFSQTIYFLRPADLFPSSRWFTKPSPWSFGNWSCDCFWKQVVLFVDFHISFSWKNVVLKGKKKNERVARGELGQKGSNTSLASKNMKIAGFHFL